MMTNDAFEAVDWQGQAIRCETCAHRALHAEGLCKLQHACVHDRYALRIDRFLKWNPTLAKHYLKHSYFEVRAIAAKYVEVFYLSQLVSDVDETVRWSVALRLTQRQLLLLRQDPDREVRIRVATRLPVNELKAMMHDRDYFVRTIVARRLPAGLLPQMIHDADREVRVEVAKRIGVDGLRIMAADLEVTVRLAAARRLPAAQLTLLLDDVDWQVRYEVAQRIDGRHLSGLLADADEAVREMVQARQRKAVPLSSLQVVLGGAGI